MQIIITQIALVHSEPGHASKMEPFVNMAEN